MSPEAEALLERGKEESEKIIKEFHGVIKWMLLDRNEKHNYAVMWAAGFQTHKSESGACTCAGCTEKEKL